MPIKRSTHRHRGKGYGREAISFYRDILRLPTAARRSMEAAGCKAAFLSVGDLEIELVQGDQGFCGCQQIYREEGEGLYHIAYEVTTWSRI